MRVNHHCPMCARSYPLDINPDFFKVVAKITNLRGPKGEILKACKTCSNAHKIGMQMHDWGDKKYKPNLNSVETIRHKKDILRGV